MNRGTNRVRKEAVKDIVEKKTRRLKNYEFSRAIRTAVRFLESLFG
jgi:hypothetical protein